MATEMDTLLHEALGSLQAEPALSGKFALDIEQRVIYIQAKELSNSYLLSWQARWLKRGIVFRIEPKSVAEIGHLLEQGHRTQINANNDLEVRNRALKLIEVAASHRASDIHIRMKGSSCLIELTTPAAGGLMPLEVVTQQDGEAIVRAIYQGIATSKEASFNPLTTQDARISVEALPPAFGLSSIRIKRGYCEPVDRGGGYMVLRLFYRETDSEDRNSILNPEAWGYTAKQAAKIESILAAAGIVLMTGPTSSGKTTSLFRLMRYLNATKPQKKQMTVEDPVEIPMDWATQIPVLGAANDEEAGKIMLNHIRDLLRSNPDIGMISEVRGKSVAEALMALGLAGAQAFSTLHVNDAFDFVDRLEQMDRVNLNRTNICENEQFRGVISQRLLPQLCPKCSLPISEHPDALTPRIRDALVSWGDVAGIRVRGEGCSECRNRTMPPIVVAEVVMPDSALRSDYINLGTEEARRRYRQRSDADPSLMQAAIDHVLAGRVDPNTAEDRLRIEITKRVQG